MLTLVVMPMLTTQAVMRKRRGELLITWKGVIIIKIIPKQKIKPII